MKFKNTIQWRFMTREDLIKELLEKKDYSELEAKVDALNAKMDLILSVIVVQQKDVCEAIGITPETVRNKVLRGETEVLQRDGSRLNFLTLEQAGELKPRLIPRKKKWTK